MSSRLASDRGARIPGFASSAFAAALAGRTVKVTAERGKLTTFGALRGLITVHPSFLLRLPDADAKAREYRAFVADLKHAARAAPA